MFYFVFVEHRLIEVTISYAPIVILYPKVVNTPCVPRESTLLKANYFFHCIKPNCFNMKALASQKNFKFIFLIDRKRLFRQR